MNRMNDSMRSQAKRSHYFVLFFNVLWIILFVITGNGFSQVYARIVRVGIYENAPKVFTSDSGKPSGLFVDIIEHIAEIEEWDLRYVSGTWAEGLDRLTQGEIDLMPDVAYTADREQRFDFHEVPVLSSWSQVYAGRNAKIQSILDLDNKRIAVLEGSVQQSTFALFASGFGLNITLVPASDYKSLFEMVARSEADAAITNRFFGLMHAKQYGLTDTAIVFDPSDLFFASPKNTRDQLLNTLDIHLASMKKDAQSVYYKSLKRWTSEDVHFHVPIWLQIAGIMLVVTLLISLIGSLILKYQVNARTRELKLINREMEQRIIQRTSELALAMEKAQAADRIKSAFLATMSHELRTPLNSIIGFTGILLQGLAGSLNPEQRKQMGMVQTSARHLLSLINDVLDISKIEAGQLDLAPSCFDLNPSIDKVVKLVSPLAEKKGLSLTWDTHDPSMTIIADQRRLEQVIINLLNNAIKFTDTGQVRITNRMEQDYCMIMVSDTGIGMNAEELTRIFKPFHQIDSGISRKHEGTGLGLSICKKIVELMDGTIHVESQWGQGSTFTVRIPGIAGGST